MQKPHVPQDFQTPAGALVGRTVAILGAGKVGQALGAMLRERGVTVVAVTARTDEHAAAAALMTGGVPGTDNAEAASPADVVLITSGDDHVSEICERIAHVVGPGDVVVHVSGALGLDALAAASASGAAVACVHPLQSFASAAHARDALAGSLFGVTCDAAARDVALGLVSACGGEALDIDDDAKARYHAAAVIASNYVCVVEQAAVETLVAAGVDESTALRALTPLLKSTVTNIRQFGPDHALTGPIVRGDVETVRRHLAAIPRDVDDLYRSLGLRAVRIAWNRGSLDEATRDELVWLLSAAESAEPKPNSRGL